MRLPKTEVQLLWLPDFITIFDSLEDIAELDRFWSYVSDYEDILGPMSAGMADIFAVFRDSHGLLVDGALTPDRIYLDPALGF